MDEVKKEQIHLIIRVMAAAICVFWCDTETCTFIDAIV